MKIRILLLFAAFCCYGSVVAGEPKISVRPLAGYESVNGDPLQARIYTLKNGLKVYLSVYKNAPRIQTYIAVKAGSKNDPATATGLAHYLEHMLFKGTDVFGTRDYAKEAPEIEKIENLYEKYRVTKDAGQRRVLYRQIDSISGVAATYAIPNEYDKMLASIGADGTNAYTSFDQTVYVNDIPSNQVSNWLKIEAERFRKPVLRLFHTELEAVYEEKNRALDNDDRKVWEALFSRLFKNHSYGTQTTIGTIEHLKNPSLKEINKYYTQYYVPNNMAIVMSGDFNPDSVIKQIEFHFGAYEKKAVPAYTFQAEPVIKSKIVSEVIGPNPESVTLGWRTKGATAFDADICTLISAMLYNGTAGLMDLDLNQSQRVLASYGFYYPIKDYGLFGISADPKAGQTLEQAEALLLAQVDRIRRGDFPEWLIPAVVTDLKLRKTRELENNGSRADMMLTAFVNDMPWKDAVGQITRISKITRQQVIDYANANLLPTNYVVVYKRTGEDKSIVKVEKPAITPVQVDRESVSPFVRDISGRVPPAIEPKFVNYEKDVQRFLSASNSEVLYNRNTENSVFELYYKFEFGSNAGKLLPVAVKYIPFLATADMSATELKRQLYTLGCSFNVFSDAENTWVSLTGLSENFGKALSLFETALRQPVVDEKTLKNMVEDIIKERADNKLQKRMILNRAMVSYARYGSQNPFTNVLTNEELQKVTADEIRKTISQLLNFRHRIMYYGPLAEKEFLSVLDKHHVAATGERVASPKSIIFEEKPLGKTVYVVDYDMTQAEIILLSNGESFRKEDVPVITLYNNYFGGGMGAVLFQELREARALAYSCYSRYVQPNKLYKKYYNLSYIGSQADKLAEALEGLTGMLNGMPASEPAFAAAKESMIQEVRTKRVTRADILFNYLEAQNLSLEKDVREEIFNKGSKLTYADIAAFQEKNIKNKPVTVLILGKKELLNMEALRGYGEVKYLDLKEIFGY